MTDHTQIIYQLEGMISNLEQVHTRLSTIIEPLIVHVDKPTDILELYNNNTIKTSKLDMYEITIKQLVAILPKMRKELDVLMLDMKAAKNSILNVYQNSDSDDRLAVMAFSKAINSERIRSWIEALNKALVKLREIQ